MTFQRPEHEVISNILSSKLDDAIRKDSRQPFKTYNGYKVFFTVVATVVNLIFFILTMLSIVTIIGLLENVLVNASIFIGLPIIFIAVVVSLGVNWIGFKINETISRNLNNRISGVVVPDVNDALQRLSRLMREHNIVYAVNDWNHSDGKVYVKNVLDAIELCRRIGYFSDMMKSK